RKEPVILRCEADGRSAHRSVTSPKEDSMRRLLLTTLPIAIAAVAFAGASLAAGSGGVSGPSLYVDGQLYRTVGTPTDLSRTGAPDHSFDTIYEFFGLQSNVATAAPGDRGFNGGRWRVHGLQFSDSAAAVSGY